MGSLFRHQALKKMLEVADDGNRDDVVERMVEGASVAGVGGIGLSPKNAENQA